MTTPVFYRQPVARAIATVLATVFILTACSSGHGAGGVTPPPTTYTLIAEPIASVKKGQPFTSCVTASPALDQIVGTYESTSQGGSGTHVCLTANVNTATIVSWTGTVAGVQKVVTSASFTILPPAVFALIGTAAFDQADSATVDLATLTSGDAARTYGIVSETGLAVRQSGSKLVIKGDTPSRTGSLAVTYFTAAQGDTARATITVTIVPLADFIYVFKNPWNETLTGETFTAAFSDGKTLTSVNGVMTGKVHTTATFTLTSPNTFPTKIIYTPATALATAGDTINGVGWVDKDSATLHFTATGLAGTQGTVIAHLYTTSRSPNKITYDQYRFIFEGAYGSGRLNPNYNGTTDTTIGFIETVAPAQLEEFNLNKTVNVYVVDQPGTGWLSQSYQVPTAEQLQGMNDAVTAWDAILSPLGMKINLLLGTPPTVSVLNYPSILAVAPGNAALGIANSGVGSINGSWTSSTLKQGGSSRLYVSNMAQVSRGWGGFMIKITAMSELGDGLVTTTGSGEDPFNRDLFHNDNPGVVPSQVDLDFYQVRFKITGPLILKNELEFEKTGTAPWPRNILLGPATSPWTMFQTYTASDGKPALQPVYVGGPLSQSTSLAAPLVTFQATATGTHVTPTKAQARPQKNPR